LRIYPIFGIIPLINGLNVKLTRCWASAACGISPHLIASACSFCWSGQTPQAGLLQLLDHSKPPCHLLTSGHSLPRIFAGTPAITGLSPIGRHRFADGDAFGSLIFMSYIHHSSAHNVCAALTRHIRTVSGYTRNTQ